MENSILKGKIAIVTGGSRGIGKAVVQMLAGQGAQVAFNYAKNQQAALALEKEIKERNLKCKAAQVDIKNFDAVKAWIEKVKQEFGRLDILVNNAGIISDKGLFMMSPAEWEEVIQTNLTGMFNASRACIVTFLKQKKGDIVNVASVSGMIGLKGQTNYSSAKGGMIAFTKALAKEVSPYGVRVNAVAPGFIETDMISGISPQQREQILKQIPLGRIGSAQDVANCVKFLLSEQAAYMTGQVVVIDGGLTMKG